MEMELVSCYVHPVSGLCVSLRAEPCAHTKSTQQNRQKSVFWLHSHKNLLTWL